MITRKKPSKTAINKTLAASSFDPRKPGPMSVIADVGSPIYYEGRAIELIREGKYKMAVSVLALLQVAVERVPKREAVTSDA